MARYRNIQKNGSYYIGKAKGAEYIISKTLGSWRAALRDRRAEKGEAVPTLFFAPTLEEVDARLDKIAAHRAKEGRARIRVDVYDGGDEPVASYRYKDEATAQFNFDMASRRADEGVEMRLFFNGKEVERYTKPEKTRRSSRKKNPNSGIDIAALKAAHKRFERLIVQEFGPLGPWGPSHGPWGSDDNARDDYQVATDALISLDTIIHMIIDREPQRKIDSAIQSFYSSGEADSAAVYIDIEKVLPRP